MGRVTKRRSHHQPQPVFQLGTKGRSMLSCVVAFLSPAAWQRMGSSTSLHCPFGREMPEKGSAAQGGFHAGAAGLKGS